MNKTIVKYIGVLAALFNIAASLLLFNQVTIGWHAPNDSALGVTGIVFFEISLVLWVIFVVLICINHFKRKK